MSVTIAIENISNHLKNAYDELQGLGADLTNVNKNIENISMVLDSIYDSMPQISGEGTSLTLDDTRVGKIKSTLKGNTSQNGTPTPTSPIPVNVVNGNNKINVCGKNLFDKNNETYTSAYITGSSATTLSASFYNRTLYIHCQPNTTYTIQKMVSVSASRFFIASSVDIPSAGVSIYNVLNGGDNNTSATYTTSNNAKYLLVNYMQTNATTTSVEEMLSSIQIKYDSSVSEYEPYQGKTYSIDLPSGMELCKIENQDHTIKYQDYFYKDSSKWFLHKEIGKAVLNGSEAWSLDSNNSRFYSNSIITDYNIPNRTSAKSDYYTYDGTPYFALSGSGNILFLGFPTSSTNTVALFKTWLTTHNLVIYYVLATPTNIEITYQPLINQLNELEKATSKENQTNISQVNNNLPFIIKANALLQISD